MNKFHVACVGIGGLTTIAVVDILVNGHFEILSGVVASIGVAIGFAFGSRSE